MRRHILALFIMYSGLMNNANANCEAWSFTNSVISESAVELNWNSNVAATISFSVYYKVYGASAWTLSKTGITGLSYKIENLSSNTSYVIRIDRNCSGVIESIIPYSSVTTKVKICASSWGFSSVSDVKPDNFIVHWTSGGSDATYDVLIKDAGTFDGFHTIATGVKDLSYTVYNLAPGKSYYIRIVRHCSGGFTDYSTSSGYYTTPYSSGIVYCFGYWWGLGTYSAHVNSIDINWDGSDGASYYIQYQPQGGNMTQKGPLYGSSYSITGLSANTYYNIKVLKNCEGNWSEDSFLGAIKTLSAECQQPTIVLQKTFMNGENSALVDISFSTNYASDNIYFVDIYKKQAGSADKLVVRTTLYGSDTYTFNLPAGADYEMIASARCGNGLNSNSRKFNFGTYRNYNLGSCVVMANLSAVHTGITSSSATINYGRTIYIDQWHSYYLAYKAAGTDYWTLKTIVVNQDINNAAYVPASLTGLQYNAKYQYAVIEKIKLKSGVVCTNGIIETFHFSNVGTFTTKGQCESNGGDIVATAYSNIAETLFYSGTISSVSPVTQSSKKLLFKSAVIDLLPGFNTTISGTGDFTARAFDVTNCQTALRTAPVDTMTIKEAKQIIRTVFADRKELRENAGPVIVFPNPTNGLVHIQLSNDAEIIRQIIITDMSGRVVMTRSGNYRSLDIHQLAAGVYVYKVESSLKTYTGKIIKRQ